MPVFAVCDGRRDIKKTVVAESLQDLLHKAKAKLNVPNANRLCLEASGADIDEDEVLLHLTPKDLIMLLDSGSEWMENTPAPDHATHVDNNTEEIGQSTNTALTIGIGLDTTSGSSSVPTVLQINKDTPLPNFSDYVMVNLSQRNSHIIWHQMIREAAQYYLAYYPNIGKVNSTDYQIIGQKMLQKWPDLSRMGSKPWAVLAADLSSRIRYMRWMNKRKSLPQPGTSSADAATVPHKAAKLVSSNVQLAGRIPDEEYERHLQEIQRLYEKLKNTSNKDVEHRLSKEIILILKETYLNRRSWIEDMHDKGAVKPILEKYDCFSHPVFVYAELKLIKGVDEVENIKERLDKLFAAVGSLIPTKDRKDGTLGDLNIFTYMEKETAFDRGKGGKTESILQHVPISTEEEIDQTIRRQSQKSQSGGAPKLIVMTCDDDIVSAVIIADDCNLEAFNLNFRRTVLSLLSVYYMAWLQYPRKYSQILGVHVLQEVVLQEQFTLKKSRKFIQWMAKIKKYIN